MPRFVVCIGWTDSSNPLSSDVDEVAVVADTSADAIERARQRWRMTIGADYPTCRIDEAFILTNRIRQNPDSIPLPTRT